ncbi:MAG: YfhO family protein [Armatimonadetes bacterium]|nr:YfhO family protein [Armatimonadota bacterium]
MPVSLQADPENAPPRLMPARPPSRVVPLAFLALLVLGFLLPTFLPLLHPQGGQARLGGDIVQAFYPSKHYLRASLAAGRLPLWQPYTFSGTPFLANCQRSGLFYPDVFLWLLLPLRWAFVLDQAAHLFSAAAGMFALTWFYTRTRAASFLAALSFAFSTFFASKVLAGHLQLMQTMTWLPWIMLCYEKALERGRLSRWALLGGVLLAVSILAGYPEIDLIFLVVLGLRFVWDLPSRDPATDGTRRRALVGNTLALIVPAFGLAAVQLLPTLEYVSQSQRFATDYAAIRARSLPPVGLLTLIVPDLLGDAPQHNAILASLSGESAGYTGVAALILGLAALPARRDRRAHFYGLLAVLAMLLCLGGYDPLYRLVWALPGFHQVAAPSRFVCMWVFALPVLAGFGVQALLDGRADGRLQAAARTALVAGALAGLTTAAIVALQGPLTALARRAILAHYPSPERQIAKIGSLFATQLTGLALFSAAALIAGALLWAGVRADPRRRARLAWGASLLAVCDLGLLNFKYVLATPLGSPEPPSDYAAALARDPELYRVLPIGEADASPEEFLITQVPSVLGYDPIIPAAYVRYLAAAGGKAVADLDAHTPKINNYQSPLVDRLNVKYVLSDAPLSDPALTPVFNGRMKVYRKAHYAPRAYVVHQVEVQPDEAQALTRLSQTAYDALAVIPGGTVAARPPGRPEPPVRTAERAPGDLRIEAAPASDGLLVVSEVYGPGWQARVDGQPAPVLKADVLLCGVPLTAGPHVVDFQYRPRSVQIGALISILTLLALAGLTLGLTVRRTPLRGG